MIDEPVDFESCVSCIIEVEDRQIFSIFAACRFKLKLLLATEMRRYPAFLFQVALYSGSIAQQGNPSPWSVTPFFGGPVTQDMTFFQRVLNAAALFGMNLMHWFTLTIFLRPTLQRYLGERKVDFAKCNFALFRRREDRILIIELYSSHVEKKKTHDR